MMGDVSETLESMKKDLADRLSTKVSYGDPVTNGDVTVIPVARVVLGYGAGAGVGDDGHNNGGGGAGGGGGGGGMVQPLGFIEVTSAGARWVPQEPPAVESALRAVALVAILAPFGGRRFLIGRLITFALVQFVLGRMFQPNLPPIPEGLRFGRMGQPS